jgi:hypothetical protein
LPEAGRALREAESLVTATTPLRRQAALAATQGAYYKRIAEHERSVTAFRRQSELYRRAGAALGEYLALGNVGSAQLDAGDVEAAVASLQQSVDGLRRIGAPFGRESRLGSLAVAYALRGDDAEVLPCAREAFFQLRTSGTTFGPLIAAALHHARHGDPRRAVLLAGRLRAQCGSTAEPAMPVRSAGATTGARPRGGCTSGDDGRTLALHGRMPDRGASRCDRVRRRAAGRTAMCDALSRPGTPSSAPAASRQIRAIASCTPRCGPKRVTTSGWNSCAATSRGRALADERD